MPTKGDTLSGDCEKRSCLTDQYDYHSCEPRVSVPFKSISFSTILPLYRLHSDAYAVCYIRYHFARPKTTNSLSSLQVKALQERSFGIDTRSCEISSRSTRCSASREGIIKAHPAHAEVAHYTTTLPAHYTSVLYLRRSRVAVHLAQLQLRLRSCSLRE